MPKPGRKTTPTKLRVVRGNPSKRELAENEVEPEQIAEAAEPIIKLNKKEREKWDRITGNLQAVGLLTVMDMDMLGRYCKMLTRFDILSNYIQQHGTIGKRRNQFGEFEVSSTQFNQWTKLNSELIRIELQFGFSPSARSGIIGPLKDDTKSEWEKFLFGSMEKAKKKA